MIQEKIKIGLFGTGDWGKAHLGRLQEIPGFEVVGFFDPDAEVAKKAANTFGIPSWDNMDGLIAACDAIDIVTPTATHFLCAKKALKKSKPVFIEHPVTFSAEEARLLLQVSNEAKARVMVSHMERYNPASIHIKKLELKPLYIESQRHTVHSEKTGRLSVIHDLLKHDLDIVFQILRFPIKKITAHGLGNKGMGPDLVNARIEFSNGSVANLTASRVSAENKEKMRIFQADNNLIVDFRKNTCRFYPHINKLGIEDSGETQWPHFSPESNHTSTQNDPLKMELECFEKIIRENLKPPISLEDAVHSIQTAFIIADKIKHVEF